jgi:hypothetical protein
MTWRDFDARDVLGLLGVGSLLYGVGQWSAPAAWVLGGLMCLGLWALPYVRGSVTSSQHYVTDARAQEGRM